VAPWLAAPQQLLVVFLLVLARISGLLVAAPWLAGAQIPQRGRAMLAIGIALVVTPPLIRISVAQPHGVVELLGLLVGELLVGLLVGVCVGALLAGMQVAGHLMGQISGMALADVVDPSSETSQSVFSQLLQLMATAIFFVVGGHRQVFRSLLDLYQAVPPGRASLDAPALELLVALLGQGFALGLRAAAPVVLALLVATALLGMISRTLPQLNILAVGFGVNALLVAACLLLSLGAVGLVFESELEEALRMLHQALPFAAPAGG